MEQGKENAGRAPAPTPPPDAGGQGVLPPSSDKNAFPAGSGFDSQSISRSDLALLRKSASQCWPVSQKMMQAAITTALKVLADQKASDRAKNAAISVLLAADNHNLRKYEILTRLGDDIGDEVRVIRMPLAPPPGPEEPPLLVEGETENPGDPQGAGSSQP